MERVYTSSSSGIARVSSLAKTLGEFFVPLFLGWGVALAALPPCAENPVTHQVTCASN